MHVWWNMWEKHRSAMNELEGIEDDDLEEEKSKTGLEDLMNNPNVHMDNVVVDG